MVHAPKIVGTTFGTTETFLILLYSFSKPANAVIFPFFRFFRFSEIVKSGFRFSSPPPDESPVIRAFIVSRETFVEQLWNNPKNARSRFSHPKCGNVENRHMSRPLIRQHFAYICLYLPIFAYIITYIYVSIFSNSVIILRKHAKISVLFPKIDVFGFMRFFAKKEPPARGRDRRFEACMMIALSSGHRFIKADSRITFCRSVFRSPGGSADPLHSPGPEVCQP